MEEIKEPQQGDQKQQIRIDDSSAETTYANFFLVSTSVEEFLLSFGVRTADGKDIQLHDRVIVTPKNFKRMVAALAQSLQVFEERFGEIDISAPTMQQGQQKPK